MSEQDLVQVRQRLTRLENYPVLTVLDQDGTPTVRRVKEIRVTNGRLIDEGGGVVSLDLSGVLEGFVNVSGTPANAGEYARFINADTIEGRTYSQMRGDLGLIIGSSVQAWDAQLDDIAALAVTNSNFIVGDGSNWVAESGNTARTSLGLGTGNSPTLTGLTLSGLTQGSVLLAGASGVVSEDNSNLFWDDTNKRLGIGINTGFDPRIGLTISGDIDILHTANVNDDHAFEIDVNAAGFGDVKAIDIDYITGDIDTGEDEGVILINIDEIAASGGDVFALEVLATEGSAGIYGMKVGVGIGPIHHDSGTFVNPAIGTNDTATTPVANMIDGDSGPTKRTSIFIGVDDYIIIGATAEFQEIEFILTTGSSGAGIKPKFEYSTGGSGFTEFSPVDGTNGFRNTGVIAWDADDLVGHAVNANTGAANTYDIRITRERNSLSTTPILGYAKTASTTEYIWDEDGDVNIRNLITSGNITISSPTPILVLKDSNSLGAASVGYIEWRDSGGGRAGFFGNSSSGNSDLVWKNEQSGDIVIQTTGEGELQIVANTVLNDNSITGVGTITAARIAHDAATYIDKDGANNMTFTDAVTGIKTLAELAAGGGGAPDAHKDSHDPFNGTDALDTAAAAEIAGVVSAGVGSSHSFARADHIHAISHSFANNHIVTVAAADVAANQYAKWVEAGSHYGLRGQTYNNVLADLSGQADAPFDWNSQNLTGVADLTASGTVQGANIIGTTEVRANTGFNINGVAGSSVDVNVITSVNFEKESTQSTTISFTGGIKV